MSESPEYTLGKVAAHAYADEMRELMGNYEKLAGAWGTPIPGVDPAMLAKVTKPDPKALAQMVTGGTQAATQATQPAAQALTRAAQRAMGR